MNKTTMNKSAQAGFTLIELIVVIVILGILAATALPKFFDLGTDARISKMQAAVGAVRGALAMTHGAWLTAGSNADTAANSTSVNSTLTAEGVRIAYRFGYPDVGGDGFTNAATVGANSGIVAAAGGLVDYSITAVAATATTLTVSADANHPQCNFTYTEPASATAVPVLDTTKIVAANC